MNRLTIKLRITLWLTLLAALLSGLMLLFMLSISSTVTMRTARDQLTDTVRSNLGEISLKNGSLKLTEGFRFYLSGVSTLVYSEGRTLVAGQLPLSFTADEPFENGLIRMVESGDTRHLVLDIHLPSGWEDGLWVRGIMEAPSGSLTATNILRLAAIVLPAFVALAAVGGYLTVRLSFRPLERITAAATAINEASDLSLRIGLPPGRDEFSRLAAAFDALFERLERSFEAEKQFTADASHELRTPVSVIKTACDYALKFDETPEERRETLGVIQRQTERMSRLISQLLSMTRLEQHTEQLSFEPLDLAALAAEACGEYGGRIALNCSGAPCVSGDRTMLLRLVQNLIDNSIKYGKPGGAITLSVTQEGGQALLTVRDEGEGIPAEHRERIWQRFYQTDPARSGSGGAGLGLSMVKRIAELHGGSMELWSIPGCGSAFTLRLPCLK